MQRFLSTFVLGILLSTSLLPQFALALADPAVDASRPRYSNYFPAATLAYEPIGGSISDETAAAKSTSQSVRFSLNEDDSILYFGLQNPFDGVSIQTSEDLGSGGALSYEYWNGSAWVSFTGVDSNDLAEGGVHATWSRPTSWTATTVQATGGATSSSFYFGRTVVENAFSSGVEVEQIGLTDYNLVFTAKDQTGASLSEGLEAAGFVTTTANMADKYFAYEKAAIAEHSFGLESANQTVNYNYTLSLDGYVAETGTAGVSKAQLKKDATFDFAYVATLMDGNGTLLTGATVTAGSSADTCKDLGSGRYGCPVGIDETASLTASRSGYRNLTTSFTTDRDAHTDAQVSQNFVMTRSTTTNNDTNTNTDSDGMDLRVRDLEWQDDGDLIVTLMNDGDEDVTANFNFEVEVDDDILYVYEVQTDGDIYLVEEDGRSRSEKIDEISSSAVSAGESEEINLGDSILEDDTETYEVRAEVDTDDDIDEDDEGNNEKIEDLELGDDSSSNDDIDLKVSDIQLQDDNDLIVVLENIGDEDVPSSKTVTTRIYVDGDLEDSFTTTNKSSTDSFLDAGERESINLGDDIVNEDDNSFTVKVIVDATDVVDEDSESNNTRTEDEDDLDDRGDGGDVPECDDFDSGDTNFRDINGHFAECEVAFLYEEDAVSGISSSLFGPSFAVTRAEFLKMALLGAGYDEDEIEDEADGENSPFRDVRSYDWFHDYIVFAENEGLVDGYRDGTFKPNGAINRAEALQMIMTIFDVSADEYESKDNPFNDIRISDWFFDVVLQGYEDGIVEGYANDYYRPSYAISRGETAAMIFRAMDVYGDTTTGGSSSNDKPDLEVRDLSFNSSGKLEIELANTGDEDVDNGDKVYITVYVDGDEEYEFYKTNSSSSSSFLDSGKEQTLIIDGDELNLDDGERYTIKVEVDSGEDVKEDSESNNTHSETLTYQD